MELPCAHYAGDVTIITYSMLMGPIYLFRVLGCDIALAGSGYITSSDTNSGPIF